MSQKENQLQMSFFASKEMNSNIQYDGAECRVLIDKRMICQRCEPDLTIDYVLNDQRSVLPSHEACSLET